MFSTKKKIFRGNNNLLKKNNKEVNKSFKDPFNKGKTE